MANDSICVFCGEKPGVFRSTTVQCGNTWQPACKTCEKELAGLSELELCQRALVRGIAADPDRLRSRIALITEAEDHRPKCVACGNPLTFMPEESLDNSPYRDSVFHETFDVLPACCGTCGRYAFYNPTVVRRNKHLAYLIKIDTEG